MLERPPGALSTRLVGRSVMKLPQFWLAPEANTLAEVPEPRRGAAARVAGSARDGAGPPRAAGAAVLGAALWAETAAGSAAARGAARGAARDAYGSALAATGAARVATGAGSALPTGGV